MIIINILVTGAPGTGKTTYSKKLVSILGLEYVSEKDILKEDTYAEKKIAGSIVKEVNITKFEKLIKDKKNVVFDGFLFPETNLKYDVAIILKLEEDKLRQILHNRDYSDVKIEDNVFVNNSNYFEKMLDNNSKRILLLSRDNLEEDIKVIVKWIKDK